MLVQAGPVALPWSWLIYFYSSSLSLLFLDYSSLWFFIPAISILLGEGEGLGQQKAGPLRCVLDFSVMS